MNEIISKELAEEKDIETRTVWYEDLANEIILKAVDDYQKSLKKLSKLNMEKLKPEILKDKKVNNEIDRKIKKEDKMRKDCEKFFSSGWYGLLTDIPGESIISKVKEQVGVN